MRHVGCRPWLPHLARRPLSRRWPVRRFGERRPALEDRRRGM